MLGYAPPTVSICHRAVPRLALVGGPVERRGRHPMRQEDDAAAVPQEVRAVPLEAEGLHRPPGLAGILRDGVVHVHLGRAEGCQQLAVLQGHHVGFGVEVDVGLLADVAPGLSRSCRRRGLDRGPEGLLVFSSSQYRPRISEPSASCRTGEEQANEYGESSLSCDRLAPGLAVVGRAGEAGRRLGSSGA